MRTTLLLEMAADAVPERTAVGSVGTGLTYAQLLAQARAGASWIAQQQAERVVWIGLNGNALPVTLFASGFAGKPFAPLNYRLSDADLRALLARTAPSVAVVDPDMLARVQNVAGVTLIARDQFESHCADPARQSALLAESEQDIAVLLFTSGTTGEPKVAMLRHRHMASYVLSTVEFCGSDEDQAALISVPPYHIAGISAVLTGVYGGRRLTCLSAFTPEAWVDAAIAEKITHAMVVPTMLGRILDVLEARGQRLPYFRALSYGGGRMPLPVVERAMRVLPQVDLVNAYGLTETSSTIAVLSPEDHRSAMTSEDPLVRRRLGSVGRALPTVELEIRDPNGVCVAAGTSGEVYVRGEQVAGEYQHRKAIRDDGWFATNDAGWVDHEGYLFLEGRLDDVIVRGGENISPGEIEDVLRTHPAVVDVAVLGVPDDQWGERVVAVVVARAQSPGTNELSDWVRTRLRSTKTPETWEFRSELPYNDSGKLLRRVLKDQLTRSLTSNAKA
jgi:fatty-acyl-CoA synthase